MNQQLDLSICDSQIMLERLIVRVQSRTPKDKPIRNIIEHKSNLILNKNIEDKKQKQEISML